MSTRLVGVSHNTEYKTYRRAGLCFYQDCQIYEVTDEQFDILKNDPRIDMHEVETGKAPAEQ